MTDISFSKKKHQMDIFQTYFLLPWRKNVVHTLQPRNTRVAIKLNKVAQTKQMKQILAKPPSVIQRSIPSSRHEMNRKDALSITSAGVA